MRTTLKTRLFATAVCTVLIVGALGIRVNSYVSEGHTWTSNQVVYYVNPQNIYNISDSAVIWAVQTGAAAWRDQSGANIQLVYGGATTGSSLMLNNKNEVFFRNDSNSYVAETYWYYDWTGHLVDADIIFHENYAYFAGSGCSNGVYLEEVATHEFGHALGLAHTSVPDATMEPAMPSYCDTSQLTLEADDISGIRALYPPTTSSSPAPSPSPSTSNTAPSVAISSPSNKSSYAAGETISFSGSASDTQDGNLSSNINWTSSIDGSIGTGASFSRPLSSGTHVITATVTDGGGLSASNQVSVTVADPPTPSSAITGPSLTARGYKVKGNQTVDLSWSGLSAGSVTISRNGNVILATANDGAETDRINKKGNGSYTYQVCAADTATCTNTVSVSF